MDPTVFFDGLLRYLILMASVCVHEWAHAWMADRKGDTTPRMEGRTTLNPVAHFDPMGTLFMPGLFIFLLQSQVPFGWGRTIRLDPRNLANPRRDEILIWLAGPGVNLLICLGAAIVGGLVAPRVARFEELATLVIQINALLAVINLLPVPPLDGGLILRSLTGMSEERFMQLSLFAFLILLALFLFPPTAYAIGFVFEGIVRLFRFILGLIAHLTGGG